jgi:hypothetical protein
MYIGDYNADNDNTPGEAGDLTPGTYPVHNAATDPSFNSTFPHLATPPTAVDYGDPSRFYARAVSGSSTRSMPSLYWDVTENETILFLTTKP